MSELNVLRIDDNRGFGWWNLPEIFKGKDSVNNGTVVPNVDDGVIDWDNNRIYRVTKRELIRDANYRLVDVVVELTAVDMAKFSPLSVLMENQPLYQPHVCEKIYLDTSVTPFTMSIDDRYIIPGTDATNCKLFKGTNTGGTGVVLSQTFNPEGRLISENVDLEQIYDNNNTWKRPKVFHTNWRLDDNEICTLVIYSADGGVMGEHYFTIKNSNLIRRNDKSQVSITGITLVSSMLSPTDDFLLLLPVNVPVVNGDFRAKLHYSDGSNNIIRIDGNKCVISGLGNFNVGVPNLTTNLVLTYYPDVEEPTLNVNNPLLRNISSIYRVKSVQADPATMFQIFVCPYYNHETEKFNNKYYLLGMLYSLLIEIPNDVLTITGDSSYDKLSEELTYHLSLAVSDLIPETLLGVRVTQVTKVTFGDINERGANFLIDYLGQNNQYGDGVYAEYSDLGNYAMSVKSGCITPQQWLNKLYRPLNTLYDETLRLSAPDPTHFRIKYKGITSDVKLLDDWKLYVNNPLGERWVARDTVEIIWLYRNPQYNTYNYLGLSPLMLFNTLI